jgi:transposase
MGKAAMKAYLAECKERAVTRAVASEQPMAQTARDLGGTEHTLHTWSGTYHRVARQEPQGQDEHLSEALPRLRKANAPLKGGAGAPKTLVEARRRVTCGWRNSPHSGIGPWWEEWPSAQWWKSHPVKNHGPGTLADLRVVTPAGAPVEDGESPALPPPHRSSAGGPAHGPSTYRTGPPPATDLAHRSPPCGGNGHGGAFSWSGGTTGPFRRARQTFAKCSRRSAPHGRWVGGSRHHDGRDGIDGSGRDSALREAGGRRAGGAPSARCTSDQPA